MYVWTYITEVYMYANVATFMCIRTYLYHWGHSRFSRTGQFILHITATMHFAFHCFIFNVWRCAQF
jgi:hypothetical protein